MQKLIRFSLFTFLFLGVLSTGSMSMDHETPVFVPVQKKMRSVKLQLPLDIRRQNFNLDLKRTMRIFKITEGATPKETKANRAAYMSDYYTLDILKEKRDADGNVKPRTNFGKAGALLDFAAGAYQRKNRDVLGKLMAVFSPVVGRELNRHYVLLISNAFYQITGAPQLRGQGNGFGAKPVPGPKPKRGVNLTEVKQPKPKDAGCPC